MRPLRILLHHNLLLCLCSAVEAFFFVVLDFESSGNLAHEWICCFPVGNRIFLVGKLRRLQTIRHELLLIDCKLNGISLGTSTQVVHSSLEALLPSIKVHRGELGRSRLSNVDIETLALANIRRAIGRHVENGTLRNLPNSLVYVANVLWDFVHVLNRTTVSNNAIANRFRPEAVGCQFTQQVLVDDGELSSKDATIVPGARVKLSE